MLGAVGLCKMAFAACCCQLARNCRNCHEYNQHNWTFHPSPGCHCIYDQRKATNIRRATLWSRIQCLLVWLLAARTAIASASCCGHWRGLHNFTTVHQTLVCWHCGFDVKQWSHQLSSQTNVLMLGWKSPRPGPGPCCPEDPHSKENAHLYLDNCI